MTKLLNALHTSMIAVLAFFTLALIGGCNSYQLGNPFELPFESIYIKPVSNDSFAPQAQTLLSTQIRDAFIRDGRTKIVTSRETADAVLITNLTEYNRRAAARQSIDTNAAASFRLVIAAEISLFNQNKGDYYFQERIIKESSSAYVNNLYATPAVAQTQDFLQMEYQAMPRLTQDLARRIADEVLGTWGPR
ncbi:MAG: LPS assembly lipoprotein LptE [Verrucomicrobiota bacterium]|nr:LPS assembly lipoprotein LptE [Verrucomicrobiota bacterium]